MTSGHRTFNSMAGCQSALLKSSMNIDSFHWKNTRLPSTTVSGFSITPLRTKAQVSVALAQRTGSIGVAKPRRASMASAASRHMSSTIAAGPGRHRLEQRFNSKVGPITYWEGLLFHCLID